MKLKKSTSRRDFIKNSSLAITAFTIVPRFVLGRGFTPPSDQLTKAVVGIGGMGRNHFPYNGTRVVAICDVDKNHLQQGLDILKDKGVKAFHDYRELIQLPEVDIVHVATPPHWHGIIAADAARAGKDVFCEKPMTRTIGEGKRLVEVVDQYERIFRLNTWFRFKDQFYGFGTTVKPIKKLVESGLLGWPLKVTIGATTGFNWKLDMWSGKPHLPVMPVPPELDYDFWLGPAPFHGYNPLHVHQKFRGYWDYDGGGLGDMGQHYMDPVQYFLGKDDTSPISVEVDTPQQHPYAVNVWRRIEFTYQDGCKIILDGEGKDANAPYIEGPKGKLYPKFRSDIPDLEKKLAAYNDPAPQVTDFLQAVRERKKFALNEQNGFRSCTLVNMAKVAVQLGRSLKFDPVKGEFIDDVAANRLSNQPMRAPWVMG
ncbi:MAG TPA: Gfo/Idh/MocA family oxidoreductase [Chitinophagaceae bacterium]|jgi:predicted dehydrogenase|nr:Gfo/Idh/MocA family oxidoreductase [Chitinophagaceae bacterium]